MESKMKEHGLLFCPEMIRAFLAGRKSMTRRTGGLEKINQNPDDWVQPLELDCAPGVWTFRSKSSGNIATVKCRFVVGDSVYAKEPWATIPEYDHLKPSELPDDAPIYFEVDTNTFKDDPRHYTIFPGRTRSAMFMPKRFARIWRPITAVGCERVLSISPEDVKREGFESRLGFLLAIDRSWVFKLSIPKVKP